MHSGYMAPEYVKLGHFSVKSDVYSFGVLVLEIVTGQSINNFCKEGNAESLLNHVSISIISEHIWHSGYLIYSFLSKFIHKWICRHGKNGGRAKLEILWIPK